MKHLMTLLALVVAVTAGAQTAAWNPDYNGDEIIGVDDLLGLLSVFGIESFSNSFELATADLYLNQSSMNGGSGHIFYEIGSDVNSVIVSSQAVGVGNGSWKHIRLPSDSVEVGRSITVTVARHDNQLCEQYGGQIRIEEENEGEWQVLSQWTNPSGDCPSCSPFPCANESGPTNDFGSNFDYRLKLIMTSDGWQPIPLNFQSVFYYTD